MGFEDSTDSATPETASPDPAALALGRFLAELAGGRDPRIEDHLEGLDPSRRPALLRELILAERDWRKAQGLSTDWNGYRERFPAESTLIDAILGDGVPTATMPTRDRSEAEQGLLFGLLATTAGLISPDSLTRALEAWGLELDRPFRSILVGRGDLDEGAATLVEVLTSKHLERHNDHPGASLEALRLAVRLRFDPGGLSDPELRALASGFAEPGEADRANGGVAGPRYEILKHHASGGLGVVSLARDVEMHREVALKEIRLDCADHADYRARFLREAEVTGRLEHPGIVPVYGIGHHDDGRPFYVMRFIRGETLKRAIGRLHKPEGKGEEVGPGEPPDLHGLVGRFIDACHAVAYAHHRKILHRDLKPINIMLGPFGETLVVDWGLAKSFDGSKSGEYPLLVEEGTLRPESGSEMTPTRVGSQVGTVGYMSPEQAAGRLADLGPTGDIYSLGATLYYVIVGRPPFEGAGKEEYLRRVREGDFPAPRQLNPSIPRGLEAVCLKALALRPIDRYPTATELAEDLDRWRAGQPVLAYPEPWIDRLGRKSRRHRSSLVGAAVLMVCSTAGLAVYAGQEREKNRRLAAANTEIRSAWSAAEREKELARGDLEITRETLRMTLNGLSTPEFAYLPDSGPPRFKIANGVVQSYRDLWRKHPADRDVRSDLAHAYWIAANIGRSLGDFAPAQGFYQGAIRLLEPLVDGGLGPDRNRLLLVNAYNDLGEHVRLAGRPKDAEPWFRKALERLARPGGAAGSAESPLERRLLANVLMNLAACRVETSHPAEAKIQASRAVEILRSLATGPASQSTHRMLLVYALNTRSSASLGAGDTDGARDDLSEALEFAEGLGGELGAGRNIDYRFALAMTRNEFGRFLGHVGNASRAAEQFAAAIEGLESLSLENRNVPFMEAALVGSLNGRAGARVMMMQGKADPKILDLATNDCARARSHALHLAHRWPDHYAYRGMLGEVAANQARIAMLKGDREFAERLWEEALADHQLALELNPESPEDPRSIAGISRELRALKANQDRSSPAR